MSETEGVPADAWQSFATRAIHAGEQPDLATGALNLPIYQSSTFVFQSAEEGAAVFSGERPGYVYTRWGNPTVAAFERKLADLEGAEAALACSSGMAAISTALLTALKAGDHVVVSSTVYSATVNLFSHRLTRLGIEVTFVDGTDVAAFRRALRPATRVLYVETPGNPTLALSDLRAVAQLAHEAGALCFADNTFATPYNQLPLKLGVDVVLHSATKYLCGHGDVIAGVLAGPAGFVRRAQTEVQRDYGSVLAPFAAWLLVRGMQTFPLRMERHNRNALTVARFLEQHPAVARVYYPGLPSHPQYALACRQMRGGGGMVCFEVAGGLEAGRRLMNRVRLCTLAVSLGDTKTLISHPASMTHSYISAEARQRAGITDGLVRLSVGLEDPEDIIADLDQALRP